MLAAHVSQRGCQGPADTTTLCPTETKNAGGLGSIAEQQVDHKVDVLLGGGRGRFEQTVTGGRFAGRTVVDSAKAKGYQYVTDADGLATARAGKPVLGLFNSGTMSLEWTGSSAALGKGNAPAACTESQRPSNEPSLAAMTSKAIGLLENRKGFFLQVEGASIDKQDHATNACGQDRRDRRVRPGDRRRAGLPEAAPGHPDRRHRRPLPHQPDRGRGRDRLRPADRLLDQPDTKDGQTLTLTYGTAGFGGAGASPVAVPPSQQHTGAAVPVWGSGPGASRILGTNDHTDLFRTLGG